MAPPLALGEVPEEVRMNKLLGMNAPPAAKVYNEKERYHVECCVEINQCVGGTRKFFTKSFLGDDGAVLARSRRCVDGVEIDATIQYKRAVKF